MLLCIRCKKREGTCSVGKSKTRKKWVVQRGKNKSYCDTCGKQVADEKNANDERDRRRAEFHRKTGL